jgi:hypothetical protein
MTIILLLLPWLLGTILAKRMLKLDDPLSALSVGWAAGWLYAIMGINICLLAGLSLDHAIGATLLLCGLLAGALLRPKQHWVKPNLHPASWLFLALGAVAVHLTANTILFLNPDDDFFLHSPMMGQMLKGTFPIINPFFPDIMYGGHYARDLLMVVAARLSGTTIFGVQAPVTVALQLAAFLVLYTALRRATGSQLQSALGTCSVFAGANAGFRGGWLDTVANNNALAQMICALCFLLALEALFVRPSRSATVMAGIALGGLAWAYETNFAVVCLGLCGLAFSTLASKSLQRSQIRTALAVGALALPLAMVQGGIFKHLLGKLMGGQAISASKTDQTLQSQNLEVSVRFPKEELFQIKLDRSGEEMSMAYSTLPVLRDLPKTDGTPGYVSVFSWHTIRIHWLALYLAPLSLVLLWRRKNWAGLLLWWVGCSGYFLPSLVNFGLWESEVFRWEYVASWGFAGALGVALGQWWQRLPGPSIVVRADLLEIRSKGLAAAALLLLLLLNSYPTLHQIRQRAAGLDSSASGLLFPNAADWFERQPDLDLHPADYHAGLWLSRQAAKDDRLLTNFREENEFNVYFESAFVGLGGGRPVGHTFPLPFERLGTRPFRLSAAARAFWSSLDPALLSNLRPDWIYLRGRPAQDLAGIPGLELVHQEDAEHSIFKVSFPTMEIGPPVPNVRLAKLALPPLLEVEQHLRVRLTLVNPGTSKVVVNTTFSYDMLDSQGKSVDPWERFLQPVALSIPAAGQQTVTVHFVTPHQEGEFRLIARLGPDSVPGDTPLKVGTRRTVTGLELLSAQPLDPLVAGQVARFRLRLGATSSSEVSSQRPLLAALVPKDDRRPLHEVRDFSELHLNITAGGQTEVILPVVVPEVTKGFELMLLPRDGWAIWQLPPASVP